MTIQLHSALISTFWLLLYIVSRVISGVINRGKRSILALPATTRSNSPLLWLPFVPCMSIMYDAIMHPAAIQGHLARCTNSQGAKDQPGMSAQAGTRLRSRGMADACNSLRMRGVAPFGGWGSEVVRKDLFTINTILFHFSKAVSNTRNFIPNFSDLLVLLRADEGFGIANLKP